MPKALTPIHRPLLHRQVEDFLKELINNGEISNVLPPEKLLARQLEVSRPVLRQAIFSLSQQGLLEVAHGKRTKILKKRTTTSPRHQEILVAAPRVPDGLEHAPVLDELRRRLEAKGYTWATLYDRRLGSRRALSLLGQRLSQRKPACLLLVCSTEAMQRWAQEKGIPTVVLGTTFANINLPSIDTDYHAVGWHAAGQLAKAGHRRISLLVTPDALGGDHATQNGAMEYFRSLSGTPCAVSFDRVSERPAEFRALIDRILGRRPPPTAFFSFLPIHTLMVLTHLLEKGLRIPEDIALISRDSEFYLDAVTPEPARYRRNDALFVTKTLRLIEKVSGGTLPLRMHVRLIPTFDPGLTLASTQMAARM